MQVCPICGRSQPEVNRFCVQCGRRFDDRADGPSAFRPARSAPGQLNIAVLYGMVVVLILAVLFPPWRLRQRKNQSFWGCISSYLPHTRSRRESHASDDRTRHDCDCRDVQGVSLPAEMTRGASFVTGLQGRAEAPFQIGDIG